MDMLNATMIVHQRICNIEPNLALDIVFHFLLNGFDYQNMIRLACGPNKVIASLAEEIKSKMSLHCSTPMSPVSPSLQPTINAIHESPTLSLVTHSEDPGCSSHHVPSLPIRNAPTTCDYRFPFCPVNVTPLSNADMIRKELAVQKYLQINENSQDGNAVWSNSLGNIYYSQESQMGWQGTSLRNGRMAVRFQEPQVKACYHYYKGYCKHGSSCKYFHGPSSSSDFSKLNHHGGVSNDNDLPSPGSLDKLEAELVELLKSKGEEGTSLAMLPLEYHEKYRKQLQAEGYMTESQRHGKAGFSLTKLITRLNSFRLIERPHGQHWVVLAENALKHSESLNHVEFGSETLRNPENRVEVSGSRIETPNSQQIYLTFPAESTFTETDVAEYFSQFGEVVSVRLPPPPKRMYGFVTFAHPESAKRVLNKGTPHNICGARVLAKPYQAKIRKNNDKIAVQMHHPSQNLLFCDRSHASPRPIENSMRTHLEEQQRIHALETRWLNRVSLAPKQLVLRRYPYEIEKSTSFQGTSEIQSPVSPLGSQLESLKLYTGSEDKFRSSNNFSCQESNMTHLPDSLFDYPPRESNGPTLFKQ